MAEYANLINNLNRLELTKIREEIPNYVDNSDGKSFITELLKLTDQEIDFREERAREINIKISHFPSFKTFEDFDFKYQPSINKAQIMELSTLEFIERKENIIFVGTSGVGKTHLAVATGIKASSSRISTYFIHFKDLVDKMSASLRENNSSKLVNHYKKYKLLIIDEIGYVPIQKEVTNVLFQLINEMYEKHSLILTTNQPFSKWGEILDDPVIANAIIDRLVHHSQIIRITGQSYRIKDKILDAEDVDQ